MGGQGVYDIVFKRIDLGASEVIRDFIELLDIVYQNPRLDIAAIMGSESFEFSKPEADTIVPTTTTAPWRCSPMARITTTRQPRPRSFSSNHP